MYSKSSGEPMPREAFSGPWDWYMRCSEAAIPGSPPVNILDQLAGAAAECLRLRIAGVDARLAQLAQPRVEVAPLLLDLLDPLVAELGAALLELLELFGGVVLLEHRHRLHGVQELVGRSPVAVEGGEEPREPQPESLEPAELLLDAVEVAAHGVGDPVPGVEQRADLRERQSDLAQREQPVQALDVVRRVQAVPGLRTGRRHEQPEAVVVVQGAHGHACGPRQLADS